MSRDFDPTEFVPVHTSLAALEVITPPQRDRLLTLMRGWKASHASLWRDNFDNNNLLFSLYDGNPNGPRSKVKTLLAGLIEPDGRAHT